MKTMKTYFLAIFMIAGFCFAAEAQSKFFPFEYKIERDRNGNYAVLTKYTGKDGTVVIPPEINGIPVSVIGSGCFAECETLTSVVPSSVTTIWDMTFYASTIKSVNLSNGLISIGANAFLNSGLSSITIPVTVKSIGQGAFAGCELPERTRADIIARFGTKVFESVGL
jgi:hypothetical protein